MQLLIHLYMLPALPTPAALTAPAALAVLVALPALAGLPTPATLPTYMAAHARFTTGVRIGHILSLYSFISSGFSL